MSNPNYYAILPAKVRYDNNLSNSQKIMFGEITALADKRGFCNASNGYFAKLYDCDPSTVSKWIKGLKKQGYIEVKYTRENGQIEGRKLRPLMDHRGIEINQGGIEKNARGVLKKAQGGIEKTAKYNNTSNNNTRENNKGARVNGVSLPDELTDVEGLPEKYEFYCRYLKENFRRWPTATTTEVDLQKLAHLKRQGNDPIAVIDQTMQARNKSFYPIKNFESDSGDEDPSKQPDYTGVANASMYRDPDEEV